MIHQPPPPTTAEPVTHGPFGALLISTILEQFDHGILLLGPGGRVLHANRVAQHECAQHGALRIDRGQLVGMRQGDRDHLARALSAAMRGRRTLLHFDGDERCLPLVVLPLTAAPATDHARTTGVMLALMAKRCGTEPLNIELFAQASGLTVTEGAVLKSLSRGLDPSELAQAHGVAMSTVRSQISRIRQKTRTTSIRALLNVVNNLPPVICSIGPRI